MLYLYASNLSFLLSLNQADYKKEFLRLILLCLAGVYLLAFLQIILHEAGHLIFGWMTGYRFLSFRIFNITVIIENRRIKLCKYKYAGTLGQCLMSPTDIKTGPYPFVLYNLGGIILNSLSAVCSILILSFPLQISISFRFVLYLNLFYGIGFSIINGIINKKARIINDGTNLYELLKDKDAVRSYYIQLSILQKLMKGMSYKEFKDEIFGMPESMELTNVIIGWHKILEVDYYMDLRQWERAYECLELFRPVMHKISRALQDTILLERLFLKLMTDGTSPDILSLYEETKHILNHSTTDMQVIRVKLAFEIYRNRFCLDNNYMEPIYNKLRAFQDYPYKGEVRFCQGLIRDVLKKYEVV
ncbi:MAG: Peptidase family [Herbinix sp.]|jgi:hypothetical protein|nr:Peptidase family [Herbinix sp.]